MPWLYTMDSRSAIYMIYVIFAQRWNFNWGAPKKEFNRCWRTIAKGIIQSNVILKNVLDKYWHGKNIAKDPTAPCATALCQICNHVNSQIHILLQCHHYGLEHGISVYCVLHSAISDLWWEVLPPLPPFAPISCRPCRPRRPLGYENLPPFSKVRF